MAAILSSKNEKVKVVVAKLGACFQIQFLLAEEKIWKKRTKYYLLK